MELSLLDSAQEVLPGRLRFTVLVDRKAVTADLAERDWSARYGVSQSDATLLEIYRANRPMLEAAVVAKYRAHRRQPVVLRPTDL